MVISKEHVKKMKIYIKIRKVIKMRMWLTIMAKFLYKLSTFCQNLIIETNYFLPSDTFWIVSFHIAFFLFPFVVGTSERLLQSLFWIISG